MALFRNLALVSGAGFRFSAPVPPLLAPVLAPVLALVLAPVLAPLLALFQFKRRFSTPILFGEDDSSMGRGGAGAGRRS